jgi:hypothetical protein
MRNPTIVADLKNFGTVQVEDAVISFALQVNGKALFSGSPLSSRTL